MQKGDMVRTIDGKQGEVESVRSGDFHFGSAPRVYCVGGKLYFDWQVERVEPKDWFVAGRNREGLWVACGLGPFTKGEVQEHLCKRIEDGANEYRAFRWQDGVTE